MSHVFRYIFGQTLAPLGFTLVVLTAIVWLSQSLQRVDIIVENGQSALTFLIITLLILPSLLAIITPFALLAAALYALNRMHSDSELVVMFAAGMSRWRVAAPLLTLATVGVLVTLVLNLWLMPAGYRVMKQKIADIRADIASSLVRGGEFNSPVRGITFFARDSAPGGQFSGILIYDDREGDPRVYMAENALFRSTEIGPQLVMADGNIQTIDKETGEVRFVNFDLYQFYMSQYVPQTSELLLELTERYMPELFAPDLENKWERENEYRLYAEGHNRLAAPLYNYVYVLIALVALIGGSYSRRGYPWRIAAAIAAALLMRVLGFVAQSAAAQTSWLNWTQYGLPLIAIATCLYLLSNLPKPQSPAAIGLPPPLTGSAEQMTWEWTVFRYLAMSTARGVLMIFLSFFVLILFIDVVEQSRAFADHPDIGFGDVVAIAMLRTPKLAETLLPLVFLFGTMWSYWQLNRHSELVVLRSAGLSAWRIAWPSLFVAIAVGLFSIFVFNPVSAALMAKAEDMRNAVGRETRTLVRVSPAGDLWLRQIENDEEWVIHARSISEGGATLSGVTFWVFDLDGAFNRRLDAPRAILEDGAMRIEEPIVSKGAAAPEKLYRIEIDTPFSKERLQESAAHPQTLSIWELPSFIRLAKTAGLPSARYELQQQNLIATPVKLAAMVLIAAAFSMSQVRQGGAARLLMLGVGAGFILYVLADVAQSFGESGLAPATLAVWTPVAAALLLSTTLLLHTEDG